jgi:MYXO-CTERM domain-containing protein
MRTSSILALAALLLPTAALAQSAAEVCGNFGGGGIDVAQGRAEADIAIAEPGFSVFLQLPVSGTTNVPLNTKLRIAGSLQDLEGETPFMRIYLETLDAAPVPFTRVGNQVIPDENLAPNTTYVFYSDFVEGPCGRDCFGNFQFTTGTRVDNEPPVFDRVPNAHAFINDICDFGASHTFGVAMGFVPEDIAWLEVAVALGDRAPRKVFAGAVQNRAEPEFFLSGDQTPLALNDAVRFALTPVDLAGHVGEPVIIRTRARSMQILNDAGTLNDVPPVQCALPNFPSPALASAAPRGGLVEVAFPFEATPLSVTDGEREVALIPVEDTPAGQRLLPAEDLAPGTWELVAQDCPFCACEGCALDVDGQLEVSELDDAAAPDEPRIVSLDEDLDPAFAEGQCVADDTAIVVTLAAGADDGTAALDLRYHASLRLADALPVQVGRLLAPEQDGDDVVLRLDTAAYGRLLTEDFELEIVAEDLSGNVSSVARIRHSAGAAAGCSGSGAPAPLFGFAILLGAFLRRRRC